MKRVMGKWTTAVTVIMDKDLWEYLFADAVKTAKKEKVNISVPEIIRRIIKKHYNK